MRVLDRRLLRMLRGAGAQYAAVAFVIFLGVMAYTLTGNTWLNMKAAVEEYYRGYGFADLFAEFNPVPVSLVESMVDVEGVGLVEPRVVVDVRADTGRQTYPTLRLVSISPGQRLNRLYVQEGRLPFAAGERGVALLSVFARANGLSVGDEVRVFFRGEGFPLRVTALVDSPEFIYAIRDARSIMPDEAGFGVGFVDLALLQGLAGMEGQANAAALAVEPGAPPAEVRDRLEEAYRGQGLRSLVTRDDQLSHALVSQELEGLGNMSRTLPVVFLGIAAAVVYVLVGRLVQADRTAIGVLKALGYGNGAIVGHYLRLSLLIGLAGGVGGAAAGYLLTGPMVRLYLEFFHLPLEARLYPRFAAAGVLLAAAFCGAAGLGAARAVLGIAPAEAMRPAAPSPGTRNVLERWAPVFWGRVTCAWKMVLRDVFRRKRRFALAVAGVALTEGVIVLSVFFWSVWDTLFAEQFGEMETYDYAVTFLTPVGPGALTEVRSLARAGAVEPFVEYPFTVSLGWRSEDVLVRALPAGTAMYRFRDGAGRPVALPESGVLLSREVADRLRAQAGDWVTLASYATGGEERRVRVQAVVTQYLGSGAYVSLGQMERLTGRAESFSGVLVRSSDDLKAALGPLGNVASVFSTRDLASQYYQYLDLAVASVAVMVLLGGSLGFAVVFNTASVGVSERVREFSSLLVMGLSRREVYGLVLRENLLALLGGLAAGVPLGRALVAGVVRAQETTELLYIPAEVRPETYLVAAALSVLFMAVAVGALWWRVRRVDFLEAMSSRLT